MLLSPEDEERFILEPARQEKAPPKPTTPTPTRPVSTQSSTIQSPTTLDLNYAEMKVNPRSTLDELCRHFPSANPSSVVTSSTTSSCPISSQRLSRLLRHLWEGSGLLQSDEGEHLIRTTLTRDHLSVLSPIFLRSRGGDLSLREEDMPELLDASMQLVASMEVERNAASILHAYRTQIGMDGNENEGSNSPASTSSIAPSPLWRYLSQTLITLGLHPGMGLEYDAFWAILVMLGVTICSLGVGFAWGVRSDRTNMLASIDANIQRGLDSSTSVSSLASAIPRSSARLRSPRQLFCANFCWVLFWLFLGALAIFIIGYIHLFIEIRNENRALSSIAQTKPVPKRCLQTSEEYEASLDNWTRLKEVASIFSPFTPRRSSNSASNDECVRYWQDYHRSITPNPAFVLTRFVTQSIRDPLVIIGGALGEASFNFLGHHSFISQIMLFGFIILLVVALAWTGSIGALWCCCCSRGGRGGSGGDRSSKYDRLLIREEIRRQRRQEYLLAEDDETDDSDIGDMEYHIRRRAVALLREEKRRLEASSTLPSTIQASPLRIQQQPQHQQPLINSQQRRVRPPPQQQQQRQVYSNNQRLHFDSRDEYGDEDEYNEIYGTDPIDSPCTESPSSATLVTPMKPKSQSQSPLKSSPPNSVSSSRPKSSPSTERKRNSSKPETEAETETRPKETIHNQHEPNEYDEVKDD